MSALDDGPRALRVIAPGDTAAATAEGAKEAAIDARITDARRNLTARLSELERRVDVVKEQIDPRSWIENPWARIGAAAAVGFVLGRSSALQPVVRAAIGAVVTALVKQALARHLPA